MNRLETDNAAYLFIADLHASAEINTGIDATDGREFEHKYENLAKHHIDGQRFVVDHIKRPLQQYAECYHLKGVTTRIRKTMKE